MLPAHVWKVKYRVHTLNKWTNETEENIHVSGMQKIKSSLTHLPELVDDWSEEPRVSEQHPNERHEPDKVKTRDVTFRSTRVKHPLDVGIGRETDE